MPGITKPDPAADGHALPVHQVVDVTTWPVAEPENAGGDEKEWLRSPTDALWLYKPRTEHVDLSSGAPWVQGEDWAEVISASVAYTLGIPTATVELAARAGRRGTISLSLRRPDWELQHGAVLLGEVVSDYVVKAKDRAGHTLTNIRLALKGVGVPSNWSGPDEMTGFDVLSGYLVLDALIANQDRHEENWAILRPSLEKGGTVLAGSYDHASSLGFNLQDVRRDRLIGDGLARWAAKARAQRFDRQTDGRLSLVQLAHQALRMGSPCGRDHWRSALRACHAPWEGIVRRVPDMSDPARTFVAALLEVNHGRLLDEF